MRLESPVPEWMLPKVWEWMKCFHDYMVDDECPSCLEQMIVKHDVDLTRGTLEYAIIADDDTPLGAVWANKHSDGIYFGHLVFERDLLTPSQKFEWTQKVLQLMFQSGAKKIVWLSLDSNRPFKLFLRKIRAEKKELVPEGAVVDGKKVPVQIYISERVAQ